MTQEHELYRQIVGSSVDGLWLVDPEGRTLYVNDRVGELLGRTTEEVTRLSVRDVFASPWWATDAGAVDVQRLYRRPDGTEVMIPFVEEIVAEIDLEEQRAVITPPPGLIDDRAEIASSREAGEAEPAQDESKRDESKEAEPGEDA